MNEQPIRENVRYLDAHVPVAVFWRRADTIGRYRHPLHWHPETEIHVITKGGGTYLIGDELHAVRRHSLVIIGGREVHKLIQAPGGCDRVSLQARLTGLGKPRLAIGSIPHHSVLTAAEAAHLIGMLRRIAAESDAHRPLWNDVVRIKLEEFLLCIRRVAGSRHEGAAVVSPLMRDLIAHLDANYMRNLSLRDLSKCFGYSSCYLSRSFSDAFGTTIHDYIRHRRVAEANAMIHAHPDQKLSVIARQAGFRNYSTFSRSLAEVAGRPPSDYRETILTAPDDDSCRRPPDTTTV